MKVFKSMDNMSLADDLRGSNAQGWSNSNKGPEGGQSISEEYYREVLKLVNSPFRG